MNWTAYQVQEQELQNLMRHNEPIPVPRGVLPANCGVDLYSISTRVNVIFDADIGAIRRLNSSNTKFKKMPNRDLLLYNDHLLNPAINTIIVDGFFGTGKTSTVMSHMVPGLMDGSINRAYISKPHESLGKGYGHLPGELEDGKMKFEFQSFTQYFHRFGDMFLYERLQGKVMKQGQKPEPKVLELLPFEYLRGRDIEDGWVILDESQNTDVKEMVTFASRPCDAAKMVLLGDSTPTQIDKRGNNQERNGLTFAKQTFADKKYSGIVEMQTVEHILRGKRTKDLLLALRSAQ